MIKQSSITGSEGSHNSCELPAYMDVSTPSLKDIGQAVGITANIQFFLIVEMHNLCYLHMTLQIFQSVQ